MLKKGKVKRGILIFLYLSQLQHVAFIFFFFPKEHFSNKYFFGELQSGVLIGLLVGYKSC